MSKYTYYVYECCSDRLVCLDLIREDFTSDFVNVHNMRTFQYEFKGLTLSFTSSVVPNWHLNRPIDKFFEETKGQLFNIEYMIKLHNFLINSMVISPLLKSDTNQVGVNQFLIRYADGKTTTAIIWGIACENRCCLCARYIANDKIFDSYSIPKSKILKILEDAGFEWHGK